MRKIKKSLKDNVYVNKEYLRRLLENETRSICMYLSYFDFVYTIKNIIGFHADIIIYQI